MLPEITIVHNPVPKKWRKTMARRKRRVRRNFKVRVKYRGKLRTYKGLRKLVKSTKLARKIYRKAKKYHGRTPIGRAWPIRHKKRRIHRGRKGRKGHRIHKGRKGRKGRKGAKHRKLSLRMKTKKSRKGRKGRKRKASGFASFTKSMWAKHRAAFKKLGIRKVGKKLGAMWRHGQRKAAN